MLQERIARSAWYNETVPKLFATTRTTFPDKAALVYEGREMSYRALGDEVDRLSQALLNLGIGKGDVVSTLPSPTPEFVSLYLATLQIGAVVNPLNLLWGTLELSGVLPRNAPKLIVIVHRYGGRDYLQLLCEALPDLVFNGQGRVSSAAVPSLQYMVGVSRTNERDEQFLDFHTLLGQVTSVDHERLDKLRTAGRPDDIQFICQTSGTTGLSKSALWDHRPPLAAVNFAARSLAYTEQERFLNLSPLFHNSGLFAINLNLVLSGSTLYLMESFNAETAVQLVDRHRITATSGFEAHWQGMHRVPGFKDYAFTIDKAIVAGDPATIDLVRAMCPAGATVTGLYAQTENGPLISLGDHDCMDAGLNKHTHGRPLPGVQVVIKNPDTGERMRQGAGGEICYRSPFMFRGYLNQPDEAAKAIDTEGYFHSGDYGHLDNGYLTYLGRLGGVVKSGGENVSTTRVSTLLLDVFQNRFDDVKTVGIPDPYWGARVISFVRTREGTLLESDAMLREACKGKMASYEIPRNFLTWEGEWPMSPEGKIDFSVLRSVAQSRFSNI
ncbi:class I adenylate-forming enzyme family protein [Noviherbaspirillum saxi]|uniref:Long-chain fatty acid--CoA ligase n=1 Tax=Noviherbaspirillum saxi TaxID=2320863 RepID=A0A3A3G210_9BURK|nr:class I adenylate-forming enzyme family protein [Noviherbaspirillum saxi]RJF95466.1 long-chain fatty acid--CoA ligase [Noviherbaspirillum saxi]